MSALHAGKHPCPTCGIRCVTLLRSAFKIAISLLLIIVIFLDTSQSLVTDLLSENLVKKCI